jgi:hypothetical protein
VQTQTSYFKFCTENGSFRKIFTVDLTPCVRKRVNLLENKFRQASQFHLHTVALMAKKSIFVHQMGVKF